MDAGTRLNLSKRKKNYFIYYEGQMAALKLKKLATLRCQQCGKPI